MYNFRKLLTNTEAFLGIRQSSVDYFEGFISSTVETLPSKL